MPSAWKTRQRTVGTVISDNTSASGETVRPRAYLHDHSTAVVEFDPQDLRQIPRLEKHTARRTADSPLAPGSDSGVIKGGPKAHITIESEEVGCHRGDERHLPDVGN